MNLKKRTVKPGSSHYWPKYSKWPRFLAQSYEITAEFTKEGWFDPSKSGPLQGDGEDINKLGGITSFDLLEPRLTWRQNSCAALVGFNPNEVRDYWDLFAYVNHADRSWTQEYLTTVPAGLKTRVLCRFDNGLDEAGYMVFEEESTKWTNLKILPLDLRGLRWAVGPSFGGNRKAPVKGVLKSSIMFY